MSKTLTPEELRKVQLLELKVLKEIKRVCTKHDIKYFLTGGTLIGAVRHKGFIPWDDDIDIAMMRPDYDRFLEIAPKELGPEYELLCIQQDERIGTFFAKVVLKDSVSWNGQQPAELNMFGCVVDVVPFDRIYENKLLAKLYFYWLNFCVVLYSMKNGYHNGTTKLKRFVARVMKFCFFWIPKGWLRKIIINYPYRLNKKQTNTRAYLSGRYGIPREMRSAYLFDEYTELPFEDDSFMVLKEYHAFLTELFGDYMKLPPESERHTHQVAELDFGKY
ncbi:MAG: LicD family protein [Spirochaetales bacterium]|nr:LicD family protein [Spirochaetales bacterium]